jgi:hypothetical protein
MRPREAGEVDVLFDRDDFLDLERGRTAQAAEDLLHQELRSGSAGGDADRVDAFEPHRVDLGDVGRRDRHARRPAWPLRRDDWSWTSLRDPTTRITGARRANARTATCRFCVA